MKKIYAIWVSVLLMVSVFAQSPERISYQAVIRNGSNQLVVNQQVGMRISIQKFIFGLPPTYQNVYVETQKPTTNNNGLISVQIGGGTVVGGTFNSIDWGKGTYYIKTETDPTGGTNYTISAQSQILSVPYALSAKKVESLETDLTLTGEGTGENPLKLAQQEATLDQVLRWNGTAWKPGVVYTLGTGNLNVSELNYFEFLTGESSPLLITPQDLGLEDPSDIRRVLILNLEVGWNPSSSGAVYPEKYKSLRDGISYEISVPPSSVLGIKVYFPGSLEYYLQYGRMIYFLR